MLTKLQKAFEGRYIIKPLGKTDLQDVLQLYRSNANYYAVTQNDPVSEEDCVHDMTECPPGIPENNKYYLGFYRDGSLAAIMDFVDGYPNAQTVYIGLFIIHQDFHGKGVGRSILGPFLTVMAECGFKTAALGCFEENATGAYFWTKLGFTVDETVDRKEGEILRHMMKMSLPLGNK